MFALYLRRHGNVPFGCPDAIIREESFPFWRAALNRFAGVCSDRPAVVPGQQKIGPDRTLDVSRVNNALLPGCVESVCSA